MRGAFVRPARVVLRRRYISKSNLPDRLSTLLGRTRWGLAPDFKYHDQTVTCHTRKEDSQLPPLPPICFSRLYLLRGLAEREGGG